MGETGGEEDCGVAAGLACGSSEDAVDSSPSHMALGLPAEMMRSAAKKKPSKKSSLDEDDFLSLLHGSDPVKIELNRLHNMVKGVIVVSRTSSSFSATHALLFFLPTTPCHR